MHVDVFAPESSSPVTGCPALSIGCVTALGGSVCAHLILSLSHFVLLVEDTVTDRVRLRVTVALRVNGKDDTLPDGEGV